MTLFKIRPISLKQCTNDVVYASICLGVVVFATCLFGISTRPMGFLANLWPANAVMLGLLIRMPAAARPLGWLCAGIAFMAADLLTGGGFFESLVLNGTNLVSVGTAYWIYPKLHPRTEALKDPASLLLLVLACAIAATTAGFLGAAINRFMFNNQALLGWAFWFTSEFVNYIAILPVMLAAPAISHAQGWRNLLKIPGRFLSLAPIPTLILSCIVALLVGGMGAIAFPVPALLWCALTYSVFSTATLTLIYCAWTLSTIASGMLPGPVLPTDELAIISARLGVSLIAIAPVTLSTVMAARNALLLHMNHLASHDTLTGAMNRRAFTEKAAPMLNTQLPLGAMMLDIDHFKQINDTYGHAAGDEVLMACAKRAQRCLRTDDIFARMGGEEFAVLLAVQSENEVATIAERIREAIADYPIRLSDGRTVPATTSIGTTFLPAAHAPRSLDAILAATDEALYAAKHQGRNRVARGA